MFPIIKRIRKKKLYLLTGILFAVVFCVQKNWSAETHPAVVQAATIATDGKGMSFDAEGNFYMTVYDRIATSSTTYSTIGWTIKRYAGPIAGNQSIRVKLTKYQPSVPDPENPQYCYNYYMIPKDVIFQKMMQSSPEWTEELYRNGGTLYFDAIMTVKEKGVPQGTLYEDGTTSGEVYTTYEGIAGARNWYDKNALHSHFDKEIYFQGNPAMLESSDEETVEYRYVSSEIGLDELLSVNKVNISSADYNVTRAIPSSEAVTISGSLQKYYYNAVYEHHYGTLTLPVTATVTYQLVWNDGVPHSENVTVQELCTVERSYSYWKMNRLDLYYCNRITVENAALPNGSVTIASGYRPQVSLVTNRGEYRALPETEVSVDGGILDGGNARPVIESANIQPLIDETIGQIMVKNDGFSVDGEVFMRPEEKEMETAEPTVLRGERKISVSKKGVVIPGAVTNGNRTSNGTAEYTGYNLSGFHSGRQVSVIYGINNINVHTPVFCSGIISDEKEFNQQVIPTKNCSLILGRNLTVSVSTEGMHIKEKGYGKRDYRRYTEKRQVCFPFPVQFEDTRIDADTWITLKTEEVSFLLPVFVEEGDYEVKFRSVAINAEENLSEEQMANLQQVHDTAVDTVAVTVVGRLSDFCITNVIDYPRWQSVFWNADKTERTGIIYFSGICNKDGEPQREPDSIFLVPLIKGSHPFFPEIHAPGLGYRIAFSLKTIGSMEHETDHIRLVPTYYFVDSEGKNRREVRLYEADKLLPFYEELVLTSNARTIQQTGIQLWEGSCKLPADIYVVDARIDLNAYVKSRNNRISTADPVFLKDGYLIVHLDITSWENGKENLNYENPRNAPFGYCDMWTVEGYQTGRTDIDGNTFTFLEGDTFVFDLKKNMLTDYESIGTH